MAELAREAGNLTGLAHEKDATLNEALTETKQKGAFRQSEKWESVKKFESKGIKDSSRELSSSTDQSGETPASAAPDEDESLTSDDEGDEDGEGDQDSETESDSEDDDSDECQPNALHSSRRKVRFRHGEGYGSLSLGTSKMKHLLDRWEEPDAKKNDKVSELILLSNSKLSSFLFSESRAKLPCLFPFDEQSTADASISDILRFRKALSFMVRFAVECISPPSSQDRDIFPHLSPSAHSSWYSG